MLIKKIQRANDVCVILNNNNKLKSRFFPTIYEDINEKENETQVSMKGLVKVSKLMLTTLISLNEY